MKKERSCRKCGCTQNNACVIDGEPCHWIGPELCSACGGNKMHIAKSVLFFLLMTVGACAGEKYPATVVHITDGDTLIAHVDGWPMPFDPVEVRLDGIDTPESRRQDAKCVKELKLGLIAKGWMREKLPVGTKIILEWTGVREKYGRLLSVVYLGTENLNQTLVKRGYAMEYHGATKGNWCK